MSAATKQPARISPRQAWLGAVSRLEDLTEDDREAAQSLALSGGQGLHVEHLPTGIEQGHMLRGLESLGLIEIDLHLDWLTAPTAKLVMPEPEVVA